MEKAASSGAETILTQPLLKSDQKRSSNSQYAVASAIIASMASLLLGYSNEHLSDIFIFFSGK
jgi:hypothetical protein